MILDTASVHTLVQSDSLDTAPDSELIQLPRLFAPLGLLSISIATPPLIFSIINAQISPLHTAPTISAFAMSLPCYVEVIYLLRQVSRGSPKGQIRTIPKIFFVPYLLLSASLWIFSSVLSARALSGRLAEYCQGGESSGMAESACVRKPLVTFLISTILSALAGLALCTLAIILSRWDFTLTCGNNEPNIIPPNPASPQDKDTETFFVLPLIFISFGISLPPFIIAILHISRSFSAMHIYAISTVVAYAFTTHLHVVAILSWRIAINRPPSPSSPYRPTPCRTSIVSLLLAQTPWLASAITSGRYALDPKIWFYMCQKEGSNQKQCISQAPTYFVLSTISSSIEVLILACLLCISCRFYYRLSRKSVQSNDSSASHEVRRIKPQESMTTQGSSIA